MLSLIVFLVTLWILILAHELGHFLMAKKAGIKVEEFGLGYPPRLWGKKFGETLYSINLLPLGGFVKLYGEELQERKKNRLNLGKAFWAKSKKARVAVIVAGVLANFLLAVLAFSIVYSIMGIPTKTKKVMIIGVTPASPAQKAGLHEEDLVLSVDSQEVKGIDHFIRLIDQKKNQPIWLKVARGEKEMNFSLVPRAEPPENEGPLGVVISDVQMKHYPVWQMPFRGAIEGFKEAFVWTGLVLGSLKKMIFDLVGKGEIPKDIAGPIGIFQIAGGVAQSGFLAILQFIGILSVNLAVINFLPFPALDGGRLMFIVYEVLTKKKPKPEFEHWINAVGMSLLLLLILVISINDVRRILATTDWLVRLQAFWPF